MADSLSIILTTVANEQHAAELGNRLLADHLAACIQEIPIRSRYRWKGEIQCEPEVLMLVKTSPERVSATVEAIRRNHKYEVPEIVVLPTSGGLAEYIAWVSAETTPR
jgi:periplasmic divalent cation tolerance protein